MHDLKLAHADIRIDNFLLDMQDRVVLCDFNGTRRFGKVNPSATRPGETLGVNGTAQVVSDESDRFGLASVIFLTETGVKPSLSLGPEGELLYPEVDTGHCGVDAMIRKAWMREYSSTAAMLEHAESLERDDRGPVVPVAPAVIDSLRTRVQQWRKERESRYGE